MKAKTWAPAVIAVVLGLGAAKLVRDSMMKAPAPTTITATPKMMQVVVANDNLIVGQELRSENLTTSTIPTPATPVDYCTRPADLLGRVLNAPVPKGQYILQTNLAARGEVPMLPSLIPPNTRAMTINVDEGNTLAGMLMPGCHVDVVATFPNGRKSTSRTLIKNLLVQAVGTRLTSAKSPDGKEPPPFHTVTLIVTPREAQVIDLLASSGHMRLLLRGLAHSDNETDAVAVSVKDIDPNTDDTSPGTGPTTRSTSAEFTEAPQQTYRVELIKNGVSTFVEFPLQRVKPETVVAPDAGQVIPGTDNTNEE